MIVDPAGTPRARRARPSARPTGPAAWPPPSTSSAWATAGSRSSAAPPTCCAAGPGSTATGPPWTRPACRSPQGYVRYRRLPQPDRLPARPSRCSTSRRRRRPSSSAPTRWPSGAYEALYERGLRVPDDMSIVGFDDLDEARWAIPPLTTVRQPLTEMAGMATRMLLRLVAGEELETRPGRAGHPARGALQHRTPQALTLLVPPARVDQGWMPVELITGMPRPALRVTHARRLSGLSRRPRWRRRSPS